MTAAARALAALTTLVLLLGVVPAAAQDLPTPDDPRVGLAPGLGEDAGQAISHMDKLASLPRPASAGIYSDLAFTGHHVISGNFNGFNIYDIADPANPTLVTTVICPGSQGDVSVHGHLLFVSVEVSGRVDCSTSASAPEFRGVRIFDISDVEDPQHVAGVYTCRGSHTHTVVPSTTDDVVYVYVSGTQGARSTGPLTGCTNSLVPNSSRYKVDVIEVPLDAPEDARIVADARLMADPDSGAINGLWPGGDHGPGTQRTPETDACHDLTAYPEIGLAAGACEGNGILIDISDPVNPRRVDEVTSPNFAYWHSATFNNDGTTVIFTDEWGGGGSPRCRATDRLDWGADAFFTVAPTPDGPRMTLASYYKVPMVQANGENCVAHNGSLVPVPGRDILVQGWYQGGISVVDFTDPTQPVEIAFFDRGPYTGAGLAGFWSAYWHNGHVYGNEIRRGFDVFDLLASPHLSTHELELARSVTWEQSNVQTQRRYDFPPSFTLVRALRDQAVRAGLGGDRLAEVDAVVDEAEALSAGSQVNRAIALLRDLADRLEEEGGHPSLVAALRDLAATFTPIPEADLATTLAVDRSTVRVNETVTLTAAVHHRGPDPVTSAELVVTLPAAATATTVPAGCAAPGAVITCDLGALAADGTAEVTIEARPTALGMHEVMATASSELPDPHPDDNTTRVLLEVLAPTPPPLPPPGPPPDPPASPAEVPVIVGDDLVGAAIEVSQQRFGDRAFSQTGPRYAVLSRDDVFADALGAAVLLRHGPLLFTGSDELDPRVADELDRLGVDAVHLLGGEAALSADLAATLEQLGHEVVRLAGPSRVETALAVATRAVAEGIADGDRFAIARAFGTAAGDETAAWVDSFTGGGHAARSGTPVLLTPSDTLHPAVADHLATRPDAAVVLLGGTAALGPAVEEAVGPAQRVAGDNRFATAVAVARELLGVDPEGPREYLVVNGTHDDAWGYGLLAAGLTADGSGPVLLVGDTVPPETLAEAAGCDHQVRLTGVGTAALLPAALLQEIDAADAAPCS